MAGCWWTARNQICTTVMGKFCQHLMQCTVLPQTLTSPAHSRGFDLRARRAVLLCSFLLALSLSPTRRWFMRFNWSAFRSGWEAVLSRAVWLLTGFGAEVSRTNCCWSTAALCPRGEKVSYGQHYSIAWDSLGIGRPAILSVSFFSSPSPACWCFPFDGWVCQPG